MKSLFRDNKEQNNTPNRPTDVTSRAVADARTRVRESEKDLERRLVEGVRKRGGMALKNNSISDNGIPDRLVMLPYHTICFVEMKSTGRKPEALQYYQMGKLRAMGFRSFVIDSSEGLEEFFRRMDARLAKYQSQEKDPDVF